MVHGFFRTGSTVRFAGPAWRAVMEAVTEAILGTVLGVILVAGCAAVREQPSGGRADGPVGGTGGIDRLPDAGAPERGLIGGPMDAATDKGNGGATVCTDAGNCDIGCGNGKIDPGLGEACDDGNSKSGDGCAADCRTIETGFICALPGTPCVSSVKCGDGKLGGGETCDDGNTIAGDGCTSDCGRETGWDCTRAAMPCVPHCGDGVVLRGEQCDPPNVGKGCSGACKLEIGFVCNAPPAAPSPSQPASCHKTVCGDGKKEGAEACDDTNTVDGDGCSGACTLEPDCASGACLSKCGDGIKLAPEACDDGNAVAGDGCDGDCKVELGSTCTDNATSPPAQLNLLATYRDVISFPLGTAIRHPDFEIFAGTDVTPNLVKAALDANGKPVMDGRCAQAATSTMCPYGQQLTTPANFAEWYHDTQVANVTVRDALLLPRQANGSYVYDSARVGFYPIDGKGWTAAPAREAAHMADNIANDGRDHNFGFTTEIHYFFQYRGGELLTFSGDDDVWIFINRKLALDLGGLHSPLQKTLNVDQGAAALGLTVGGLYEIALFHAERHSGGSNFKLTLTGFAPTSSACAPTCGDGIVVAPEQCDLGKAMNTGGYNGCTAECRRGPFCGDAVVQSPNEECDDGNNVTTYGMNGMNGMTGCAPGCVRAAMCGDGKVDGLFGEQCDLGAAMNDGAYNGCTPACLLGPRCGDGMIQKDAGEECDDGNTVGGDGCSHVCRIEVIP